MHNRFLNTCIVCAVMLMVLGSIPAAAVKLVDAGAPFGPLPLVQEINCAEQDPDIAFQGNSGEVKTILDQSCRTIPNTGNESAFIGYRIGAGLGLEGGRSYVITVEYPEDTGRSFHIANWGCETVRGIATGPTIGDSLKDHYVNNNAESIQYPLSGKYETWKQLFFLHDRFPDLKRPRGQGPRPKLPEEGFLLIFAQPEYAIAPLSAGLAVRTIRLFEVPDPSVYDVPLNIPPGDLPRRHLFWREEMSDAVVSIGHSEKEKAPELRGVENRLDWYENKARLMKFVGMDTFCRDILEFGHNQGWDSQIEGHGPNDWVRAAADPTMWGKIVSVMGKYKLNILPYYEYYGSFGDGDLAIGSKRRCRSLSGKQDYTHIDWVHYGNADLMDPDILTDAQRILEYTITRHKDKANFIGAWFRPRPEANPVSFNEMNLGLFAKEANGGKAVERAQLQADKNLLDKYYEWWFTKRKAFLENLTDTLRKDVNPDAFVLYTTDVSEPGLSIPRELAGKGQKEFWNWKNAVVTDQPEQWNKLFDSERFAKDKRFEMIKPVGLDFVLQEDMYRQALTTPGVDWGDWEWRNACPENDPQNYRDSNKVLLSYSFNRIYTVSSPAAFDDFRTKQGLAAVRHYPLNEHQLQIGNDGPIGYFVSDMERTGPHCMAAEALAMANGDPRYMGYLVGNSFNCGFPQYVRNFNSAFLALPALPSKRLSDGASDSEVVVREIKTAKHGTYLAVVNTSLNAKTGITITLPEGAKVVDATTGKTLEGARQGNRLTLDFYPCQLRAIHVIG
jgi:hypothetical protein